MQVLNATLFAERISDILIKQQIIEEKRRALYVFGLRQIFDLSLNIITVILIGLYSRMLLQIVLFMLAYSSIRCYAGGYHAKTKLRCYLCSVAMFIVILPLIQILMTNPIISLIVAVITAAVIFILAPVEHKNKPLRENERKVYRQRARILTGCELLIAVIAAVANIPMLSAVIATAFLMLCIMLVAGSRAK